LKKVFCLVLEFREEMWTFAKVEEGDVDFSKKIKKLSYNFSYCFLLENFLSACLHPRFVFKEQLRLQQPFYLRVLPFLKKN
jgi:hypothetical protein